MIDEQTKQLILDTASIVDVVSDYVSLKKQGANFVGLCPFHNDRRPSFHVSPSLNICKCFACGEGGTPVSFIMKIEKQSFYEALRTLAAKYHIQIEEHTETDEDRKRKNEAESMYLAQKFAAEYFSQQLSTPEGKAVAMAYLSMRGIMPSTIEKFAIGYASSQRSGLYEAASKAGYNMKYFTETGLCYAPNETHETGSDRFRERIIFPIHTVSGRIVAFGGRILKKSDKMAKYINSPESAIYSKSNELYGLYFAKKEIVAKDRCFLVEGYMDVIAMHENGITNVVASSGTALTSRQIKLIRRFTQNITVFYDGDAAGIKAALRGIDLLLEAGMHIRVLLLPEGEDPDSFSRSRTKEQFELYIKENEQDFITFKAQLFKEDMLRNPLDKSRIVSDILRSIALIPDPVERSVTAQGIAQELNVNEEMLLKQVKVLRSNKQAVELNNTATPRQQPVPQSYKEEGDEQQNTQPPFAKPSNNETAAMQMMLKYGALPLPLKDVEGNDVELPLVFFVKDSLDEDEVDGYGEAFATFLNTIESIVEAGEKDPLKYMANHEDMRIASLAVDLVAEKYTVSKVETQPNDNIEEVDPQNILLQTIRLVDGLKGEYIMREIEACSRRIKEIENDPAYQEELFTLLHRLRDLNELKKMIAQALGNRVII